MKEKDIFCFPEQFWSELEAAGNRLLMIDYDGTIAPFRINQKLAYPYPGTIELLRNILRNKRNRVAIISGRSLSELKDFIRIEGIHLFGSYGLEEELNGFQESYRISGEEKEILEQGRLRVEKEGINGRIEEKPYSIAFHVRGIKNGNLLIGRVKQVWKPLEKPGSISVVPFNGGVELTIGHTKDFAVEKLLRSVPSDSFSVYIGDDDPDEPAFVAVNQYGWAIKIGKTKKPTAARLFLKDSQEFFSFLKCWLEISSGKTAPW